VPPLDHLEPYCIVVLLLRGGLSVKIGETFIEDTFAEAFRMRFTRLLITAHDRHWLESAAREFNGYGTSIIACDAEAGMEQWIDPSATPDGRVGASILAFGFSAEGLAKAVANRAGQCLMTCPTTAVFDGLSEATERIPLGRHLRYFGDGYQKSKKLAGRRYWRIPVMDGEFLIEDSLGVSQGVAGGNIILQAVSLDAGLAAARRASDAIACLPGAMTPFPGGVVRSGSKVGSRYKGLRASTADAFCPTLRGRVVTKLYTGVNCAYEIVIDGVSEAAVSQAMAAAMRSAAGEGIPCISAGNYGGKLGKYQLRLREILDK
jgi:formylmethanofuran--tetrahydromethanopterin N-formyltransferase